jgi:hypothetical protein
MKFVAEQFSQFPSHLVQYLGSHSSGSSKDCALSSMKTICHGLLYSASGTGEAVYHHTTRLTKSAINFKRSVLS